MAVHVYIVNAPFFFQLNYSCI